ncbi:acetate--CoA ligase family protein [Candidatus Micrarchaeota archaeon]|nr:acetate--CoA ligase family protein [Candidatus Micrarchaeota archaeon]
MILSFIETQALLAKYDIPTVKCEFSSDFSEIEAAFKRFSPPCVLKLISSEATHKTEKGLLMMDLRHENDLLDGKAELERRANGLKVEGFLLQEQLSGFELIVGGKFNPAFGQTIIFGPGGVLVEMLDESSVRICPLTKKDAEEMLSETRARKFFEGFRGKKASKEAVLNILLKTSRLLEENPRIRELDFNPVIADEKKAWIADSRIVIG